MQNICETGECEAVYIAIQDDIQQQQQQPQQQFYNKDDDYCSCGGRCLDCTMGFK